MTSQNKQWQDVKENYLKLIEKKLAQIDHPRRAEILENVREHLDSKYAELSQEQQNWDAFQQIITEMGPPEEYAELLGEENISAIKGRLYITEILAIVFLGALIGIGSYLVYTAKETPTPKTYIITFKPISPFDPQTAQEMLTAFNKDHPSGVRTHHYRTKVEDDELVGFICVDSKSDAEDAKKMLERSDTLEFIKTKPVTQQEFAEYCQLKQVSLSSGSPSIYDQVSQSPVIFIDDLPVDGIIINEPDCTADFVQSLLGSPKHIDSGGKMLRYTDHGFDLWFSGNEHLSEVHLNRGFKGKLGTGISIASSMKDVFDTYGQPIEMIQTNQLSGQNQERVLRQKGDISRIFYGQHGLIFWFKGNAISQIVPFRGQLKNSGSTPAPAPKTVDFELDDRVLGKWITVDFVKTIEDFNPSQKKWQGELFLKELTFENKGILWWKNNNSRPYKHQWTKGKVDPLNERPAFYYLRNIEGQTYLFYEWVSGDVTLRGREPSYYVLKQTKNGKPITPDWFKNDPQALGFWTAVDFVPSINKFEPGQSHTEDFFIKTLDFNANGKLYWTVGESRPIGLNWTRDTIRPSGIWPAAYVIKQFDKTEYLFYEYRTGDRNPAGYYVFKRASRPEEAPWTKNEPFKNDPQVLGQWITVDFVRTLDAFQPNQQSWQGKLWVKSLRFQELGTVEWCLGEDQIKVEHRWTKGKLLDDKLPARYFIETYADRDYLFMEWNSGDVTIRGQKPCYYVLKRVDEKRFHNTMSDLNQDRNQNCQGNASSTTGKITFIRWRSLKQPDCVEQVNLASGEIKPMVHASVERPSIRSFCFSPDKKQFLFEMGSGENWYENNEIYIGNSIGENIRQVTNNKIYDGDPVWSPDGKRMAFTRGWGINGQVYLRNLESGEEQPLPNPELIISRDPHWLTEDGLLVLGFDTQKRQGLVDFDLKSGTIRWLLKDQVSYLCLSPDRKRLACVVQKRNETPQVIQQIMEANDWIYSVNIFTLTTEQLKPLNDKQVAFEKDACPIWSHNGEKLAWIRNNPKKNSCKLLIYDIKKKSTLVIPLPDEEAISLMWAPDDNRIACVSCDQKETKYNLRLFLLPDSTSENVFSSEDRIQCCDWE